MRFLKHPLREARMHSSGPTAYLTCGLLIVFSCGCQSPLADRSVRVTENSPEALQAAEQPRTLLAERQKPAVPESTAVSSSLSDTHASIDGGTLADSEALLQAFQNAGPEVQEAARRRMLASQQSNVKVNPLPDLPTQSDLDLDPFDRPLELPNETTTIANITDAMKEDSKSQQAAPNADAFRTAISDEIAASGFVVPTSHSSESATTETVADLAEPPAAPAGVPEPQPESPIEPAPTEPTAELATPTPAAPKAPVSEAALMASLLEQMSAAPTDDNDTNKMRQAMRYRLQLVLAGRIDEAVEPIEGLDSSEQEFFRNQVLALWTAIDPQGHPVPQRRWTTALPQLREAVSHLAAATGTLEVRNLAFCTDVESYGRIKTFDSMRFNPGQQVILYSEVDSFAAERLSTGYETQLQGSYEIFDSSGKRIAEKVLPTDQQVCNNYRRDYFIAYRLHLPSQLADGKYRMELTMEDLKGKKYGQSSIEFEISNAR
ncbi:hypothetical protein [Roseimaritima multifibrata]|nr:hypothetical protein [Roseimaritima multifibrata]